MGLFDDYEPNKGSENQIKLEEAGDLFAVTVTDISDEMTGDYGTYFFVTGEIVEGEGEEVPAVGEEGTFLFPRTRSNGDDTPIFKELRKALGKASGLQIGDLLGVKLIELITHSAKGKKYGKPFRKTGVVVQSAQPASVFNSSEVPF